jgi:DNA-directed RNA polymerase subunit RPC12/RpoP
VTETDPIKEKDTSSTSCERCGANMVFDAKLQTLKCPHCGHQVDIVADNAQEIDFQNQLNTGNWAKETQVWRCANCGAKQVVSKKDIAKSCPFCGVTNVSKSEEFSGSMPNAVVPFKIQKDEANKNAKRWASKKKFAPNEFKRSVKTEDISGMYCPAFTFDAKTYSRYTAVLGKYYYVQVKTQNGIQNVQKIRYWNVSGDYVGNFDDVTVQASTIVADKVGEKLGKFNTNDSKAYNDSYLQGFSAEFCTKSGNACYNEAKSKIDTAIKRNILAQYSYDVVQAFNISTEYSNIKYKQVLLPIYVGKYRFKKKLYNFFVNGENGHITGKTPISFWKVLFCGLLGIGILGGIVFALYHYGMF